VPTESNETRRTSKQRQSIFRMAEGSEYRVWAILLAVLVLLILVGIMGWSILHEINTWL